MNYINITVREKMARAEERARIVCGNSDYAVKFDFDDEWSAESVKTARFTTDNGTYTDVQFEGDTCTVPILANTRTLQVGVYAGNLRTTTAALIHAVPCITDPDGTPADPTPDVYAQLMERFNAMEPPAAVLYTAQELTYDQKKQAKKNIAATGSDEFTIVNTYDEIASCGATSGVCQDLGNGTPDGMLFPVFFLFSEEHYGKRHVTMLDGEGKYWGGIANGSEIQNMTNIRTVPDWNQNDETAADYIKNRPFYRKKAYHYTWDGTRNETEDVTWAYPSSSNYNCLHFISSETPPMTGRLKWATSRDLDSGEWIDINEGDYPARTTEYGWMKPSPGTNLASAIVVVTTPNEILTRKGIYFGGLYDPNHHTDYNYGYCAEFESGGGCQTIAPDYLPTEIQADWNQNDESAVSYIKNRPFYEISQTEVILDRLVSNMGTYTLNSPLVAGDTYECSISDTTLNVTCTEYGSGSLQLLFGSKGVLNVSDSQNEPLTAIFFGSGDSNRLKITHKATEVKKIDAKYLPEKFLINLTFDDDGNPQSDKTFEEIQVAYNAGQTIVLCFDGVDYALSGALPDRCFGFNVSDAGYDQWVWIRSDGVEISSPNYLPIASDNEPLPAGTASAGSDEAYARADHVHPTEILTVSVKKSDGQYQFVAGSYADIQAAVAAEKPVFLRLAGNSSYGDKFTLYVCWKQLDTPGKSGQYYFRLLDAHYATSVHTIVVCSDTDIQGKQDTNKEIILWSSTAGSSKKFKLTVDDTGIVTATEITD